MKCMPDCEFVVLETIKMIELRTKSGEYVSSICCKNCLSDLKKAIKKLEKVKGLI